MKKIISLLLVLFVLVGCSKEVDVVGGDVNNINERGYIVVAMEGTWAPWTYHDDGDKLVGFDVEVGKYIADYMGIDVKYVEGEWDGLLAGVEAGRYDMMINGCDVTDERKKSYDFSDAYAYDRIAVIVNEDNTDITSLEDLSGKTTANTSSSTYAAIASQYGATVNGVDDLNETFMLLENGRIDATLNAEMTFNDYMKERPDAKFKIACYYPESPEVAIAMKKGSSELVNKVNEAIAAARADGTLSQLSIKYFGVDITNN